MKLFKIAPLAATVLFCATPVLAAEWVSGIDSDAVLTELKASFSEKNGANLDRFDQSFMQKACSTAEMNNEKLSKEVIEKINAEAKATVKLPADGEYLGDWRQGEKIAQSGRGLQYSDKPGAVNGGNCYACHEMTKSEISFGNIGTSLLHYGKLRGNSKEILEYTWVRLYNPHTYETCSVMPRFGDAQILTEEQMKHVMALLFDPTSPVNDDSVDPKGK